MSDPLHPLRHAYGLDDRPPEGGGVEGELFRQMRRLLEAAPPVRPEPATVAAVEAAAAEAGDHGALRAMLDGDAVGPQFQTEAELIRGARLALDTLPPSAPDASTLDAIFAAAADASATLAPIRAAYGLGDADFQTVDSVEVALLTQTRAVLGAARREQRPDDATLDAVLAHAAAASLADDSIPASAPDLAAVYGQVPIATVPAALMAGADAALDRLPTARPSDDALAAVLAAAAAATRDAQPAAAPVVVAPAVTPAVPLGGARRIASPTATAAPAAMWARRPAVWGSVAAMLAAVVIVANLFGTEPTALPEVAALTEETPAVTEEAPQEEAMPSSAFPPPPSAPDPAPISSGAAALAAGGPMAGAPATASPLQPRAVLGAPPVQSAPRSPVRQSAAQPARTEAPQRVRTQAPPASAPVEDRSAPRRESAPVLSLSSAIAAAPLADDAAKTADSWEAGEDVRLLSLRLQELRRQNQGLDWDDAEAFGAPAVGAASGLPGVQSVGFGRQNAAPAARARAIVDSTTDRR